MLQAFGDRAYDDVRRSIEAAIHGAAHRARGTVVKLTGDGGLLVFESAADAIDAAIALQTEIALLPSRPQGRVQMRIGLSVGDVTVERGDCHGTPVVEAARLEAAAPPGGILCTTLVKLLAGSRTGATFVAHAPVVAKGFDTPLEAWEIPWASTSSSGGILAETLHRRELLPFAGRHDELATVMSAVVDAATGRGRGVLIGGEPGIGKSRLTREVARRAASDGAVVLHGRCDDGMGRPYQPFAEALAAFLRLVPGATDQLGPGASDLRLVLPELVEAVPGLPEPLAADSDTLRHRLAEAVAGWLRDGLEPAAGAARDRRPALGRSRHGPARPARAGVDRSSCGRRRHHLPHDRRRGRRRPRPAHLAAPAARQRRAGDPRRARRRRHPVDGRRVRARLRRATSPVSSTSGPEAMPSSPPRCCSTSTPTTTRRSASTPSRRRSTTSSSPESRG